MRDDEYKKLVAENRARFCAPYDKNLLTGSQALTSAGVSFDLEDQKAL